MCPPVAAAAPIIAGSTMATTTAVSSSAIWMAAITAAMSAASIGAQTVMQAQQAKQQNKVLAKSLEQNYQLQKEQEDTALVQKMDATQQEEMSTSIEAAQARSRARVAAGEAGVAGLSVDALVNDFTAAEGRYRDNLQQNMQWETQAYKQRLKGNAAQGASTWNQNKVQKPSFLGAALRIGGSTFDAYNRFRGDIFQQVPASLPKKPPGIH